MLKKVIRLSSLIVVLSFTSCGGGGGSEKAKELLEKILQFVGIPQQVIVNVCQDSNRDGICGGGEIFTKVVINKGDSLDDILEKISLTSDGRYFLQTLNPELPIVVELKDAGKVNFDNGKFALSFNGFKTKKDDNETKEVSILESMVDANALSKDVADKFRNLTNAEAQDKYYTALFDTLETNINTLRANDLDSKTAVSATIKEMADETITNQEQANRINGCENNQSCVDSEIKKVSDELIITDDEASEIKVKEQSNQESNGTVEPTPTATATPTPIANSDGKEVQYGKWVKPSRSDCESGGGSYNKYDSNDCSANWENANSICSSIGGVLPNHETLGAVVTDCGGDFVTDPWDNWEERTDKNIANEAYQACYKEKGFTSDGYWSATTVASDSSNAWYVDFNNGNGDRYSKTHELYLRCVRGGQ